MKRILLLADDPALSELAKESLSEHELWQSSCVHDALGQLDAGRIDLAIVDFWLPDGTAVPILRRLRHSFPDVPVILVSGGDRSVTPEVTEAFGTMNGADLFLTKPIQPPELKSALQSVLSTERSG